MSSPLRATSNQKCDVVMLRSWPDESVEFPHNTRERKTGTFVLWSRQESDEPLVPEFLAVFISRLCHSVRENDQ